LAEQSWQVAQRLSTPTARMAGHGFLVEPLYYLGELSAARAHLERAWALYNPQEHNLRTYPHWMEHGVGLLMFLAMTSWLLGYPDQAQQRLEECLAWAEKQAHPYSLAAAWRSACRFHSFHQEWERARVRAEAVMTLATEQGFPYLFALGAARR